MGTMKLRTEMDSSTNLWLASYQWRTARGSFMVLLVRAVTRDEAERVANMAFQAITGYTGVDNFGNPDDPDDNDTHRGYLVRAPMIYSAVWE